MVEIFSHSKVTLQKKRLLSKNGLRIAPRALVKLLEKCFFSNKDYFPKMALELLQEP